MSSSNTYLSWIKALEAKVGQWAKKGEKGENVSLKTCFKECSNQKLKSISKKVFKYFGISRTLLQLMHVIRDNWDHITFHMAMY